MNYLKTILLCDNEELTKMREQQTNPSQGDFIEKITDDCEKLGIDYKKEKIITSDPKEYKKRIKTNI